jgi:uncharacterized protein
MIKTRLADTAVAVVVKPSSASAAKWLLLVTATVGVTLPLTLLGVPAAALLAGLLVGITMALMSVAPKRVPARAQAAAQAVLGVYIGTMVHPDVFAALGSNWPVVVAVVVGTLVLSTVAGGLLGRRRDVSPLTGALALVAGGASGLVSIARELGGDDRVVAVVQYLRIALIVGSMPLVAMVFAHGSTAPSSVSVGENGDAPWYLSVIMLTVIAVAGVVGGQFIRLLGAGLLGPLSITILLEVSGLSFGLAVPSILVQISCMLIGWQAGLVFTRQSLRAIRRILPAALGLIMLIDLGSAGLGWLLAQITGVSRLDGYLATNPGAIYAVLPTAVQSGANVMFILAAQVIRSLLMLFAAPPIAGAFARLGQPHDDRTDATRQAKLVPCVAAGCANAGLPASDNRRKVSPTISLDPSAPCAA